MHKALLSLVGATILLGVPCTTVRGTEYHLDPSHPSASDSNPGTSSSAPWATLAKANATLVGGDTVIIAPGTYRDDIDPTREGTPGNLITYKGSTDNARDVKIYTSKDLGAIVTFTRVTTNPFGGGTLSNVWKFPESAVLSGSALGVISIWEPDTDADIYSHYVPNGADPDDNMCWDPYMPITAHAKQESNKLPKPDNTAEGVRMVDAIPGSFYRDGGDDTVYFHTWGSVDPNTLQLEVNTASSSPPMGGTGDFGPCLPDEKEYIRLEGLSCFGRTGNYPKPRRSLWLGRGNQIDNVIVATSKAMASGNTDLDNLVITNSIFCGGIHITPNAPVKTVSGMRIENNIIRGSDPGSSRIAVEEVKGVDWSDPIVIRGNTFLTGTSRRPDDDESSGFTWDWTIGDWRDSPGFGGSLQSQQWKRSGHGLFIGSSQDTTNREGYILVEQNIFTGAGDGVGIFSSDNVRVWNNVFGDDDDSSQLDSSGSPTFNRVTKPQRLQLTNNGAIDIRNNVFIHFAGDANEYSCGQDSFHLASVDHCDNPQLTSDYNIYISTCAATSVVAECDDRSLTGMQAAGNDVHSQRLVAGAKGTYFVDRKFDVNNYRLASGSPLIDAGDPSLCSRPIQGGACDVGIFEAGASGAPADCGDGLDNDGDGAVDFPADFGCTSAFDSSESGTTQCGDGADNDGDSSIDQNDPGCEDALDNDETDPDSTPPGDVQQLRRTDTVPAP